MLDSDSDGDDEREAEGSGQEEKDDAVNSPQSRQVFLFLLFKHCVLQGYVLQYRYMCVKINIFIFPTTINMTGTQCYGAEGLISWGRSLFKI